LRSINRIFLFAFTGLSFGIVGFFLNYFCIPAIFGIVFSLIALVILFRNPDPTRGFRDQILATLGLALSVTETFIFFATQ
jgi:hypothetical protein